MSELSDLWLRKPKIGEIRQAKIEEFSCRTPPNFKTMIEKEFENYRQKVKKERVRIADENYKAGALAMLKMVAKEQAWEESEEYYYNKFFKK